MDDLDRRILRQIQRDNSGSALELARACGTTESTALRRIKRMRKFGIIRSEVAIVDPAKIGRSLMIFIHVRLEREDGPGVKRFVERVRDHPAVIQFHFVTGTPDYVLLLSVRTMEDYDHFLQQCLVSDPLVVMSETNVVIRTLKMTTAIPIDEGAT